MSEEFGQFLRSQRLKMGHSLRGLAKEIEMKPSNLSFIESGKANPPRSEKILLRIADALHFKKGSGEWAELFDLSTKESGVPADISADDNMRECLPIMLRTIADARLTKKELKELIDIVKKSKKRE